MLIERFPQAHGDGFQVAARKAAVGGESFGHDQYVAFPLREVVVVGAQETADIAERILFCGHRASVGIAEHLASDLERCDIGVALLAALDEVGILGEATGIDIERNTGRPRNTADLANVGHGDRLAADGVVGNGHHDDRYPLRAVLSDQRFECRRVHVPFERIIGIQIGGFRAREVDGLPADKFDVAARGIEMRVVRHDHPGFDKHAEQDVLGRATLVRGYHLPKTEDVRDGIAEAIPAARTGIGFVAAHQRPPGVRRHCAGAGVRQQIDDDVFGT